MAIKRASKQIKYGIIRQSPDASVATAFKAAGATANEWTNPAAADQNFRTVYYTAGVPVPDPGVTVDEYNVTSQLGLNRELTNFFIDARSGLARLNFSAPADKNTLAPHLIAGLQAVSEAAGTPFSKSITSGFVAGTIDFNGGAGHLHTLAIDQGSSADDGTILENAIIDTLNLTWDFNAKGVARLVQMDGTWVGNEMNFDQTLSGTWVATTLTPFNNTDVFSFDTFTVDSVDWKAMCIRRLSLSINNNITSNCSTTAGKPNQYDVNPEITWTIVLDHNLTTEKMMGDFQAGAAVDINFGNALYIGAGGQDGTLGFDSPNCRVIAPPMAYNGDFLGYSLQARAYQSSTTSPLTVQIVDTLDWGY
jgi:hypothetical protein